LSIIKSVCKNHFIEKNNRDGLRAGINIISKQDTKFKPIEVKKTRDKFKAQEFMVQGTRLHGDNILRFGFLYYLEVLFPEPCLLVP
jgi:hypothetical protein